jgi:HSP20 family protein
MTLVRFNNPDLVSRFADEFFNRNFFDNEKDSYERFNTDVKYFIDETEKEYRIDFAVPGLTKKDFEIELDNDLLVVKTKERDDNNKRTGFEALEFNKQFRLSEEVDKDKISAHTENGVLSITLPKIDKTVLKKTKPIKIA